MWLPTLLLVIGICSSPGCGSDRPATFAGIDQALDFQRALQTCLRHHGVRYTPVVRPPGSVNTVVPMPVPAEWWARHGGYGLVADQTAEVELDPSWSDPNQDHVQGVGIARWSRALYGEGMNAWRFDPGSCFDRSLRAAGFWSESRAGSLREPTRDEQAEALVDPAVARAADDLRRCLRHRGLDERVADDPKGELRQQFLDRHLITEDGTPSPTASTSELRRAEQTEERTATAEARCRAAVAFDQAYDTSLRRLMGAHP